MNINYIMLYLFLFFYIHIHTYPFNAALQEFAGSELLVCFVCLWVSGVYMYCKKDRGKGFGTWLHPKHP